MTHPTKSLGSLFSYGSGRRAVCCAFAIVVAGLPMQACGPAQELNKHDLPEGVTVSPRLPQDITGGAFNASLGQAAEFAWNQMIAMNWAAAIEDGQVRRRGVAAGAEQSATLNRDAPRVWQTLRPMLRNGT